jgi:chlorophyll synthase
MATAQAVVVALLASWERPLAAAAVATLLAVQLVMMRRFLRAPRERALWLSAGGVPFYVLGMMASACALRATGG